MQKHAVLVLILVGNLLSSSLFAGISPLSLQGQPIAATPYDQRLAQAGILSFPADVHNARSAEDLFAQAKAFRYKQDDRGSDYWQTPAETQARWSGDCEDKAVWLFARLKQNGFDGARLVIGRQHAGSGGLHVWVTLSDGAADGSYLLDPTAQKRIWRSTDFSDGSYRPLYSFDGLNRYRHDA